MSGSTRPLPRFVVFGEALTDFVRTGPNQWHSAPGGACWNVARVASTLGLPTAWAGAVSDDLFGEELVAHSRRAGLDERFLQVAAKPPLIAVVHETQPPRYFFLGTDTADLTFDVARLPAGWQDACELAHFGCISLVRQPLGARLEAIAVDLKRRGARISFDPNVRNLMGADYPAPFERMARLADVIKMSDEDLAHIYPGEDPAASLARVRAFAPTATLLFTRGARGITLLAAEGRLEQPAFAVTVADTVGAGDASIGGFLASRLLEPSHDEAVHVRFAAATAAAVCAHSGAHAPSHAEVEALLAGR